VPCGNEDILSVVTDAFATVPGVKPYVGTGIGELGPVFDAGYDGFGVYGGPYRYFHTPNDGPQGTAPELLEPVASALTLALARIESKGRPAHGAGSNRLRQ
jgi:hypothetical protein